MGVERLILPERAPVDMPTRSLAAALLRPLFEGQVIKQEMATTNGISDERLVRTVQGGDYFGMLDMLVSFNIDSLRSNLAERRHTLKMNFQQLR